MKKSLVVVFLMLSVMGVALVGCAPTREPQSDGLHSTVPAVVGKSLPEATSEIEEAGYEVGEVTPERPAEGGTVSAQNPVAGTSVARGSKVDLVIDGGR